MTIVRLHGLLAKNFGSIIKLHLGNLNHVISAVDSIKNGFRNKIKQLADKGFHYFIYRDPTDKIIHIMPYITGAGKTVALIIIAVILIIAIILTAGAASAGVGAFASALGSTSAAATTAAATSITVAGITMTAGFAAQAAIFLGSAALSSLYSVLTAKGPEAAAGPSGASTGGQTLGGGTSTGKSYVFSSENNQETQGSTIPLGYGKMRLGSKLIHFGVKNMPSNISTTDEFTKNEAYSIFSNHLAG